MRESLLMPRICPECRHVIAQRNAQFCPRCGMRVLGISTAGAIAVAIFGAVAVIALFLGLA